MNNLKVQFLPFWFAASMLGFGWLSGEAIAATNLELATSPETAEAQRTPSSEQNSLELPANAPIEQTVVASALDEPANPFVAIQDLELVGQVTSVSQFTDVQPTDWAYEALRLLAEDYDCIEGYPDGTFRGNRVMTRYEFAAGLAACLDAIASRLDNVSAEDLQTLQRLQQEFAAELATLRGRVDSLEAAVEELEANQFSTTTVLHGETIFGLANIFTGDNADGDEIDSSTQFGYRVRLNLETSFTGEDLLTTRLQVGNVVPLGGTNSGVLGTNEGRIEYDGDTDNEAILALLRYRFPLGPNTNFYIAAVGNGFVDLDASTQLTPYLDGVAVSLFALRNSIYNYSGGTGFGLRHQFNDNLELNLGYLVPDAGDPSNGNGLFNGKYGALAQLIVYPTDFLTIGFTYINAYNPTDEFFGTATGSNLANSNFGRPVSINAYGISGTWDITPNLALGGWVGYAHQRYIERGDGDVWNWGAGLSFPDLFGEGNTGGLLVGMEPRLTYIDDSVNGGETDPDVSLHIEGFYRYRLSDNMDITPGFIWTTAPDHNADNDDVVTGVLRTRFFF